MKKLIEKFTYHGKFFDYTGAGYAIDEYHVYKNDKRLNHSERGSVTLYLNKSNVSFGRIRLFQAVVHGLSADVEAASGLRVVNHDLLVDDANRYVWETPDDRKRLIQEKQALLDASDDLWLTVVHNDQVFDKYEINKKTGRIRHKSIKRELTISARGQVNLCLNTALERGDAGRARVVGTTSIYAYRIYMWTYVKDRRNDQTDIDHINGDHMDHRPCNLRWASPTENAMYKFAVLPKRAGSEQQQFTGCVETLNRFEDTNWYFGFVGEDYAVVHQGRVRRVGDFRVTQRLPYPMIRINYVKRRLHCVVAFVEGRMTKEQFYDRKSTEVVRHINNDKADFRPDNLVLGTASENATDTQNNPETSKRKRVRQIDERGLCTDHASITAAAKTVSGSQRRIYQAIHTNGLYKNTTWTCDF
jgi:hypothetical protein